MSHPSAAVCVSIVDQADRAGPAQPCGCVCTAQTSSSRAGPGRNAARLPQAAGAGPLPPLYFDSKERRQTGRAGGRCTRKPCQPTVRRLGRWILPESLGDSEWIREGRPPARSVLARRIVPRMPSQQRRGRRPAPPPQTRARRRQPQPPTLHGFSRRIGCLPPESRRRPASRRGGRRRRFPRRSESALQVGPRLKAARPVLEGRGGRHRAGLGHTDR